MKYSEIRDIAQDGDIVFLVSDQKIASAIIAAMTKSPYTHVAMLFWYHRRLMLVESTVVGGLRLVNASVYNDREMELVRAPKLWWEISDRALGSVGQAKYGMISALYIGFRDICYRWFGYKLPPNRGNRNKACSEFVSYILDMDDPSIPPRQLYEILNVEHRRKS